MTVYYLAYIDGTPKKFARISEAFDYLDTLDATMPYFIIGVVYSGGRTTTSLAAHSFGALDDYTARAKYAAICARLQAS